MKNSNLMPHLTIVLFALFSMSLTSCGDGEPQFQKTNLELVKKGIVGTTWTVTSVTLSDGTTTFTSNFCSTGYNYIGDLILEFTTETKLNQSSCGAYFDNVSYTLSESNGVFKIKKGTNEFELLTLPENMHGSSVQVKRVDGPIGSGPNDSKNSIWTFAK